MSEREEDDNRERLRQLDDEINTRTGDLIDANAKMTQLCRSMARDMVKVALAYESLAQIAREISDMHAESGKVCADLTGDIVASEWQLEDEDEDTVIIEIIEDDEDEEDEDEDDDQG